MASLHDLSSASWSFLNYVFTGIDCIVFDIPGFKHFKSRHKLTTRLCDLACNRFTISSYRHFHHRSA